jgi:hypothetical protein
VTAVKEESTPGTSPTVERGRGTREKTERTPGPGIGHGAILKAIEENTQSVVLPVLGEVHIPASREALAWYAGLVALTAIGVMEWPVAAAIGVGHLLAHQQHMRLIHNFGEALEEA